MIDSEITHRRSRQMPNAYATRISRKSGAAIASEPTPWILWPNITRPPIAGLFLYWIALVKSENASTTNSTAITVRNHPRDAVFVLDLSMRVKLIGRLSARKRVLVSAISLLRTFAQLHSISRLRA